MIPVTTLAPFSTRYAIGAMVCTVDGIAAEAGIGALRAGGCAADAAIAAGAVLAVTHQHQCGLGGDLFALVHRPGYSCPAVLNASGRAGSGAHPTRLRDAGHQRMPTTGDPACAPVPGCVDGWVALHQRFGRLPLAELLEPARRHAADGFAASPSLATATRLVAGVPGAEDYSAGGTVRTGQVVRRPGIARALEAIRRDGRRGFYEGEFGQALIELGAGEYASEDLVRSQADWVSPLAVDAFGGRLWSAPPNSQGYLLLSSAAVAADQRLPGPGHAQWVHRLIAISRACARDRDAVWHERSDGRALIAPERIAALRERVMADQPSLRASTLVRGDTVSLCVIDSERMAVSMLQSNFVGWGSMRFVHGVGVALHNRGSSFSLRPGHPAEYGPGRRPPHTLAPAIVTRGDGSVQAALATRGGHNQPDILLQLLARHLGAGQSPAEALVAGRWAAAGEEVLLEGHAPERWAQGLRARGHRVAPLRPSFSQEFGQAQLIVSDGDGLAGASDPRSAGWAVATL